MGVHERDGEGRRATSASSRFIAHGTTVVINALTERKGVKTALITTEGFRDSLEIARGNRPDYFNLDYEKPPPFVPRYLRREVPGRITHRGVERRPLDLDGLPEIVDAFRADGVEAVAICLLNAYVDPAGEQAVLRRLRELWPNVSAVASHQITREWREYERTSTTVLSAYVQPVAERYLSGLSAGVSDAGFGGQLYVMQSNCGVDSVEKAQQIPITMVESGPASGVLRRRRAGTTDRRPERARSRHRRHDGEVLPDRGRTREDHDRLLDRTQPADRRLSDHGAGRRPGRDRQRRRLHRLGRRLREAPRRAAIGRRRSRPGRIRTRRAPRRRPPTPISRSGASTTTISAAASSTPTWTPSVRLSTSSPQRLGVGRAEAARGVVRIANNNMVNALKLVSVNRGHDPRDFTLVAFGGGGGMHAVELAAELGISKVVIPRAADVFSAWGMLMSDLRRDYFVTRLLRVNEVDAPKLDELLRDVTAEALEQFAREGRLPRAGALRALREVCATRTRSTASRCSSPTARSTAPAQAAIADTFHQAYEREYTYRLDAPIEFVSLHLVAIAEVGKLAPAPLPQTGRRVEDARKGRRDVDYAASGVHEADIYDGDLLEPGQRFSGPAIVETKGSTTVVHPGNRVAVDDYGNLVISIETGAGAEGRRDGPRVRPDHARDHPELAAGDQRRDVRRVPEDRDERHHLRGARHGHRASPTATATSRRPAPASPPSSACSTRP